MDELQFGQETITTRFGCIFDPNQNEYSICMLTIDTEYDEVIAISPPVVNDVFISHAEALAFIECIYKDVRSQFLMNNSFVLGD